MYIYINKAHAIVTLLVLYNYSFAFLELKQKKMMLNTTYAFNTTDISNTTDVITSSAPGYNPGLAIGLSVGLLAFGAIAILFIVLLNKYLHHHLRVIPVMHFANGHVNH